MTEQKSKPEGAAQAPTAAECLAAELRQLRLDAGRPSFRIMARTAGCISHTTLYEAASGSRLPSWPTTRAFVRACGGDEAQWHRRWNAAVGAEPTAPVPVPAPLPAPLPAAVPVPAPQPVEPLPAPPRGGGRLRAYALTLLVGVVLGIGGTLGLLAVRAPAAHSADASTCPAEEETSRPATGTPPPSGHAGSDAPSWISRTASDQQAGSSTEAVLPVLAPVTQGDALVVTMMLTGTCAGAVTVTDTRGDRFQIIEDVTDALRHRVLLLTALGASALTTADSIRVTYPRASTYHVAVDEFRGVSAVRSAEGTPGDTGGDTAVTTAGSRPAPR
ncbi:helix-turn-helix domain-containing protein [Kitasatospora sp. NPDC091207]|uniref:helix-turn-helix domain-containing protein n=1 Tax=Kitasatospora sp. NPDC091207 TaxID=3364083 RepID=UPI00380D9915